MLEYEHTQRGWFHCMLLAIGAAMLTAAWLTQDQPPVPTILFVSAILMIALAAAFMRLTVRDGGDRLVLRFGPLPLLGKSFRYADISEAAPDKSRTIDGWGIHWIPGRGTTYNLWGYDCVRLRVGGKTVRIGSDDVENLAAFVRSKIQSRNIQPSEA